MESFGIPDLGPFALLQAAVSVVIVGGALIAWLRGTNNRTTEEKQSSPAVQLYMDGPLQAALGFLKSMADSQQGIYRVLGEMRADFDRNAADDARRKEAELDIMRDIRDGRGRPDQRRRR